MDNAKDDAAISALNLVIQTLGGLDENSRRRVLDSVAAFFSTATRNTPPTQTSPTETGRPQFTADYAPSPKQFLIEKQPQTDIERIATLAYYLTHYRETPHFKTLDLAKLNTEAAQPKFSNTAYSAANAAKLGYLAPGEKGQRQLSAAGEQFVRALPDRDAAKLAMNLARPRRYVKKGKSRKPPPAGAENTNGN